MIIPEKILLQTETIGQMAAKDSRKAAVFQRHGLDFCCGGKQTLDEACEKQGLDKSLIEKELADPGETHIGPSLFFNEWKLDFLATYIENTHHAYVRQMLPLITACAAKVAIAHGELHPELRVIDKLFKEISTELAAHMVKEERLLFPYIRSQVNAQSDNLTMEKTIFGSIANPVSVMETEHEMVGKNLETIRELSAHYALPPDACGSYQLLYKMLNEFEADLHIHVHLENNILFPKAILLEEEMNDSNLSLPA